MAAVEHISLIGEKQVLDSLDVLDGRDRANTVRRAVRAGSKPVMAALKQIAAGAKVPRSFQKIPAAQVTTHGGVGPIEAIVRPKSPLFNIFEPGAKEHEIAPRSAEFLAGPAGTGSWDPAGRKRADAFFSRGPVRHPGMSARPILAAAAALAAPAAQEAMAEILSGRAAAVLGGE